MKIKAFAFGLLVFACFITSLSQNIVQLGVWPNNANFVIKYHQDRVIASTTSGITFLDVSDPYNPVPSASIGNPSSFPMAIEIADNYAYFGGGMTGYLMIADISNINFPIQVGITNQVHGTAYEIAVSGNYAFMPTSFDTLYAIDISNKSAPFVASKIDLGTFSFGIEISGTYAYVGTNGGLKVVDISNPLSMNVVNSFGGGYQSVVGDLQNDRLFLAKSGQGFDAVSIANPTSPTGLFQGIGGNSIGRLDYKAPYAFQIGQTNVSAFRIGSTSSYLCSFSALNGQINAVTAKDSIFYVSTVNDIHVLKLGSMQVGLDELVDANAVISYPNPAHNTLTVKQYPANPIEAVAIFDNAGRRVKSIPCATDEDLLIDVSDLPIGLYHISVETMNGPFRSRFVKQ